MFGATPEGQLVLPHRQGAGRERRYSQPPLDQAEQRDRAYLGVLLLDSSPGVTGHVAGGTHALGRQGLIWVSGCLGQGHGDNPAQVWS